MLAHEYFSDPEFGKCILLYNESYELIIPLEFGIRIIHFSKRNGKNLFFVQPNSMKDLTTEDGWRIYGGHRMWIAPEGNWCYTPDNQPIEYTLTDEGIILVQSEDERAKVIKTLHVQFTNNNVIITHEIQNTDIQPIDVSIWAITSMTPEGIQTIPFAPPFRIYNPNRHISLWDYTQLSDPRAKYLSDRIILSHKPLPEKYKIGINASDGNITYEVPFGTFQLNFDVFENAVYPDGGSNYETFMCCHMTELESLSPIQHILPNERISHIEKWSII